MAEAYPKRFAGSEWQGYELRPVSRLSITAEGQASRLSGGYTLPARNDLRLFYCIGAQKAGTSWLHRFCAEHEELHAPDPKELDYWGTVRPPYRTVPRRTATREYWRALRGLAKVAVTFGNVERARAELQKRIRVRAMYEKDDPDHAAYLAALRFGMRGNQLAADISPQYAICGRETFAEMASIGRDARFVFIMREPAARLWSSVRHQKRAEISAGRFDAQATAAEYARILQDPGRFSHMATDYAHTIEELEAAVDRSRILYLFYETLFDQKSVDRITRFLGVSSKTADFAVVHGGEAVDGDVPDSLLAETRRVFRRSYEVTLDRFGDAVPAAWRERYLG